jgi:hypothetical protein
MRQHKGQVKVAVELAKAMETAAMDVAISTAVMTTSAAAMVTSLAAMVIAAMAAATAMASATAAKAMVIWQESSAKVQAGK